MPRVRPFGTGVELLSPPPPAAPSARGSRPRRREDELARLRLLRARMGDVVARVPVGHEPRVLISASAHTVRQFLVVAGVLRARSKKELFSFVRP